MSENSSRRWQWQEQPDRNEKDICDLLSSVINRELMAACLCTEIIMCLSSCSLNRDTLILHTQSIMETIFNTCALLKGALAALNDL